MGNGNPQVEEGYTKIANEILDTLCKTRIAGVQRQILDFIIRKTYGYNKKTDRISLSQFSKATRLKTPTICKGLKELLAMNIITKDGNDITKNGNEWMISYGFNKHYTTWKPLPKKVMHYQKSQSGTTKNGNGALPKMVDTKEIYIKENNTKEIDTKNAIAFYCEQFKFIFKTNPSIRGKEAGIVKRLLKYISLGQFQKLILTYLNSQESWFKTKGYDLATFEGNLNKIKILMEGDEYGLRESGEWQGFYDFQRARQKDKDQRRRISTGDGNTKSIVQLAEDTEGKP